MTTEHTETGETPTHEDGDQVDSLVVLRHLRSSVEGLKESADRMVSKEYVENWQRREETKRKAFATLVIGVGTCFIVLFGFLAWGLWLIGNLVEEVKENSETTLACSDPDAADNECYDERLRRSKEISDAQTDDIVSALFDRILDEYLAGTFGQPAPE